MKKNMFWKAGICLSAMLMSVAMISCNSNNQNNPTDPVNPTDPTDPTTVVDLVLSASSVDVAQGEDATVEITSGNGGYVVISADENVATATVAGTTVTIHGVKGGSTTISVKDAAKKAKPIAVKVSASGVNNINTDVMYTIDVLDSEKGQTNWWQPELTRQVKNTLICTKRDFTSGKLNAASFDASVLKEFFDLIDDDNVFVCGGYIADGSKPDYGYAAPALLLTDKDDPAHEGCKVMTVITSNLAAYCSWGNYSSTGGTAYYNPTDGSFTIVDAKGFLDWQGSENEKWYFTLNRTYTPQN